MMKEEFLDSYHGLTWRPHGPYGAPKSIMWLGDDHSDDDAICEPHKKARLFVALGWLALRRSQP